MYKKYFDRSNQQYDSLPNETGLTMRESKVMDKIKDILCNRQDYQRYIKDVFNDKLIPESLLTKYRVVANRNLMSRHSGMFPPRIILSFKYDNLTKKEIKALKYIALFECVNNKYYFIYTMPDDRLLNIIYPSIYTIKHPRLRDCIRNFLGTQEEKSRILIDKIKYYCVPFKSVLGYSIYSLHLPTYTDVERNNNSIDRDTVYLKTSDSIFQNKRSIFVLKEGTTL